MHFQDWQPVEYNLNFSPWAPGSQMAHAKSKLITLAQVAPMPKALPQVALNILKPKHGQG